MLKSGASMKELQSILGHDDFSTTSNTYAHVSDDDAGKVLSRVAGMFGERRAN
jgi:site-specific recombinase XerD